MKKLNLLPYLVLLLQFVMMADVVIKLLLSYFQEQLMSRAEEKHLWFQLGMCIVIVYAVIRFLETISRSAVMRREAGMQFEIKSSRIQIYIFLVMVVSIFYFLYYTVPMNKYIANTYQKIFYYSNSFLLIITLIKLLGRHEKVKYFVKSTQRFAGAGAFVGLALFYIYYLSLN